MNMKLNTIFLIFLLLFGRTSAASDFKQPSHPDCSGVERWATSMAFVDLKNAGLINNETVDFTKTRTVRLASERIGDDLYIQIHNVIFTEKSGKKIEVITKNNASNDECSMSSVDVFLVRNILR